MTTLTKWSFTVEAVGASAFLPGYDPFGMCATCALEALKSSSSAGSMSGVQALFAAGFASVGMRSVSGWLVAHEFAWATPRRVKAATMVAAMIAMTVAVQMSLHGPSL